MPLAPGTRDHLRQIASRLDAAAFCRRGPIVQEVMDLYGWSKTKVYDQLRTVGWSSGRKVRADKGSTCVSEASLLALGAMQRESLRKNGKQERRPDNAPTLEPQTVTAVFAAPRMAMGM